MSGLKASFEKTLKQKLSQKASGNANEETVLLKAFKYFDLNNNGTVEPDEFAKAVEKIGIMIPTRQDLDSLFNLYDKDQSGGLDYREFASEIFQREVGGTPARGGSSGEDLLQRLRDKLKTRGARGIIGLSKQFRIMDDNHSMSLDKFEFSKAMSDYMLGFSEGETQKLFSHFDFDRSGLIEYDEFLRAIRGPMTAGRKAIAMRAFNKMDKDGSGMIDIDDIRGVYSAGHHPDVKSGKKTEQQVLSEFLETFETAHSMRNQETPDHIVSKDEWVEYYNNVSASIDNDEYFALMMNNAWNLDGSMDVNKKKGWKGEEQKGGGGGASRGGPRGAAASRGGARGGRGAQGGAASAMGGGGGGAAEADVPPMNMTEAQLMDRFREKLAKRGNRGIMGLGRSFKIADDDRSGDLGMEEFQKAIHDFRVGLQPAQSAKLFKVFDRDGSGTINYEEFLRGVRGAMNDFRQGMCMKAFKIMDIDNSGKLEIDDIRQRYNAKMHPDVKAGKKTEDEILYEFIDTFEQHHTDNADDAQDGTVTTREWIEYYNNVSMSVDRDDYFELMMNNAWNLKGDRVTKKAWGAEV